MEVWLLNSICPFVVAVANERAAGGRAGVGAAPARRRAAVARRPHPCCAVSIRPLCPSRSWQLRNFVRDTSWVDFRQFPLYSEAQPEFSDDVVAAVHTRSSALAALRSRRWAILQLIGIFLEIFGDSRCKTVTSRFISTLAPCELAHSRKYCLHTYFHRQTVTWALLYFGFKG